MTDSQNRTTRGQLHDAAAEIYMVVAPAVGYGIVALVVAMIAGSILFDRNWVTVLLSVTVLLVTVIPIVFERVHTLGPRGGPDE